MNKRNIIIVVVSALLLLTVASTVSAAWFGAHWFSIDGWNGPLRLDVQASCANNARIEVMYVSGGWTRNYWYGRPLNGNWRISFTDGFVQPTNPYWITFYCYDTSSRTQSYVSFRYSVFFGSGRVSVTRLY